jgi:hypothetical protein
MTKPSNRHWFPVLLLEMRSHPATLRRGVGRSEQSSTQWFLRYFSLARTHSTFQLPAEIEKRSRPRQTIGHNILRAVLVEVCRKHGHSLKKRLSALEKFDAASAHHFLNFLT